MVIVAIFINVTIFKCDRNDGDSNFSRYKLSLKQNRFTIHAYTAISWLVPFNFLYLWTW